MGTNTVRPEHPRPQRIRPEWLNLNGEWQFEEDPGISGEERGYTSGRDLGARIIVPFAPESELSGIGKKDFMPCVWYRRTFRVPETWKEGRILLHFGAVDYQATVWLNGKRVGDHTGGYSSFYFDITALLQPGENELVLRAIDQPRGSSQPRGKQSDRYKSYGCVYTRTTGIWQTVWLEHAGNTYISDFRLRPQPASGTLAVEARIAGDAQLVRLSVEAKAAGRCAGKTSLQVSGRECSLTVKLDEIRLWSPDDPFLYGLKLALIGSDGSQVDIVESYFGMRTVGIDGRKITLNGKPVFMRLVLDQGFYPDGIYTAPTDEALKRDIEIAMGLGFNGARLHEKVFEPRFLYWADQMGYLVWGEYPNWGLDESDPGSLVKMLPEWLEVLERDFNHPSIIGWCPFNETRPGQDPRLLRTVYRTTKQFDPTRMVMDTSGYVHVETDVDDCHNYEQDPDKFARTYAGFARGEAPWRNFPRVEPANHGQPYFVSEYGGIWWNPGQEDNEAWGYGNRPRSEEEFLDRYRRLTETLLFHPQMCGFCYTQLYDIEQEVNGLYTYDRRAKFAPELIRAINSQPAAIESS